MSGDSEGNLLFWNLKEFKINRYIKEAHEGSIFSILSLLDDENTELSNKIFLIIYMVLFLISRKKNTCEMNHTKVK